MFRSTISRVAPGVALLLLIALALMGCQGQTTVQPTQVPAAPATQVPAAPSPQVTQPTAAAPTQAPAVATQAPVAPETLRIGISMVLTGPANRGGVMTDRVIRMAFGDISAKGGVKVGGKTYRIEAVTADDRFASDGGRDAANRLILAEKVKIILGPSGPPPTAGAQPLAEQNNVLLLPSSAGQSLLGPDHRLTLTLGTPHTISRAAAVNDWLVKNKPQAKRMTYIGTDDQNGHTDALVFEEAVKSRGLTVAGKEFYPADIKDFSPVVTRVLAQKPDGIQLEGTTAYSPQRFLPLTKALYEQGFKGVYLGYYGGTGHLQAGAAGEGFVFTFLIDGNAPQLSALAKDVWKRFVQKYGEAEADAASVIQNYNMGYILAQAFEKAGTVDDNRKIADTLREGEWDSTFGKVTFGGLKTFGIKSQIQYPVFLTKIDGGKFVNIDVLPGMLP